jgi:hypothetical protein
LPSTTAKTTEAKDYFFLIVININDRLLFCSAFGLLVLTGILACLQDIAIGDYVVPVSYGVKSFWTSQDT